MTRDICSCLISTSPMLPLRSPTTTSRHRAAPLTTPNDGYAVSEMAAKNYYSNPAFSQQSEFYNGQPLSHLRQSPVGAPYRGECTEQEFYEEMLVDDAGVIKEKKVLVVSSADKPRYEYIPMRDHRYVICQQKEGPRYAMIDNHRYEYIQDDFSPPKTRYEYVQPPSPRRVATQKLHELLSTPPKKLAKPPPAQRRLPPSPQRDPFLTPKKNPAKKLNYTMQQRDKRHMAVVAPICSSPVQSVYSETTFMHKTESWMNLGPSHKPTQLTLAVAAVMMMLCGGVASGLCFYMVSIMGRLYFLDFGIVAGFTCLLLGLLGFRTRNCYWLPNRNYISGYLILSVFSLLMCAGLLVLLVMQPKAGTPLADMTSGAVCGISVLSLVLASAGVIASYCCKYPPPDNRVQHSVPGFTV